MSTEKARGLRKKQTDAERKLWRVLRNKQMEGLKFRRQEPIGKYIVDFVCFERKLIIELDGGQHVRQQAYDEQRTKWLSDQGFKVVRFWDNEVLKETTAVQKNIWNQITKETPHPGPLPQRGEGR